MICKKCGESLHPRQPVCLKCGTQTEHYQGGATKLDDGKKPIPWKIVGPVAGVIVLLLAFWMFKVITRVPPPDEIALNWVRAVSNRRFDDARKLTTEQFEGMNSEDQCTSERKSDEYVLFMHDYRGDYKLSGPKYDKKDNPSSAQVTVTITGEDAPTPIVNTLTLRKEKRCWRIYEIQ